MTGQREFDESDYKILTEADVEMINAASRMAVPDDTDDDFRDLYIDDEDEADG